MTVPNGLALLATRTVPLGRLRAVLAPHIAGSRRLGGRSHAITRGESSRAELAAAACAAVDGYLYPDALSRGPAA